ncbi:MAG: YabP/YqfC family sporulation protein [Clostridia bacterium]|nr:YabP/YqfC family sporulation protein [Clostridia bacterium]
MRLYDEIFKNADGFSFARCTVVPNGGGYFEGVKAVGDFSPERIVVCFPRGNVEVEGKGLAIKKYYDGDLQLSGKILSLRVEETEPAQKGGEV